MDHSIELTETGLDTQLRTLQDVAARTNNPCVIAEYIALADPRVRTVFLKKFADGYVFRGISCLNGVAVPENRIVYFDFDCPPGVFCLIKPAFSAVVNVVDGYVTAVLDPYLRPQNAAPEAVPGGVPVVDSFGEFFADTPLVQAFTYMSPYGAFRIRRPQFQSSCILVIPNNDNGLGAGSNLNFIKNLQITDIDGNIHSGSVFLAANLANNSAYRYFFLSSTPNANDPEAFYIGYSSQISSSHTQDTQDAQRIRNNGNFFPSAHRFENS